MKKMRFYNTLTREKADFMPIDVHNVRMYVCGPTVYDYAHIGNARPVIVFDVLFRLLRYVYGQDNVLYARNITDVDDKINARAVRDYPQLPLNDAIQLLTQKTNAQFQADVTWLGCLPPTTQPRATDHLDEMRALIEALVKKGHAYVADDHVLFAVSSMGKHPRYGALARRALDEMIAGARVDVASYKRNEMDFVLWKPAKDNEPGWPAPAGIKAKGRPGWHIECSAMSMAKLLQPFGGGLQCDDPTANVFDIHGGGIDLVFPHHENEIAQSCSALSTERMANLWMHNGFLQVEGQKMSKSLNNFVTIKQVFNTPIPKLSERLDDSNKEVWLGLAARFSMLQTHYREPLNWTEQRLLESSDELYRWYVLLRRQAFDPFAKVHVDEAIIDALADDLNVWNAITLLRQFYKKGDAQALGQAMALLGLINENLVVEKNNRLFVSNSSLNSAFVEERVQKRLDFIADKNWLEADKIRDELREHNIVLKDEKDSETGGRITTWQVQS